MMKKYATLGFLFSFAYSFAYVQATQSLDWLNDNILSVLDATASKITHIRQKPVIGFFSLDVKFDGEHIKICELGNGLYNVPSGSHDLKGHYALINGIKEVLYTPYWDIFWTYLHRFDRPIYFIGKQNKKNNKVRGLTTLRKYQPSFYNTKAAFNVDFPECDKNITDIRISDYRGIIAYTSPQKSKKLTAFVQKHQDFLFVNPFVALFHRQKYEIHTFFNTDELIALRPMCVPCKKEYTKDLYQQIVEQIPGNLFVIKPNCGHAAKGVLLVEKRDLDNTLKSIMEKQQQCASHDKKIKEWKHKKNALIEEFAVSKVVYYNGKPYDPTLRVTFLAMYEKDTIVTTLLSAFWKFPPASLDDVRASLTDKHITQSMSVCDEIAPAMDHKDMEIFSKKFNAIAPTLFEKMIEGSEQF